METLSASLLSHVQHRHGVILELVQRHQHAGHPIVLRPPEGYPPEDVQKLVEENLPLLRGKLMQWE